MAMLQHARIQTHLTASSSGRASQARPAVAPTSTYGVRGIMPDAAAFRNPFISSGSRIPQIAARAAPGTTTQSTATSALPPLSPLDSSYADTHSFAAFGNWLAPGVVMVGRYPYCEPSRCDTYEKGEAMLQKILETGITTFVSLQAEVPAQEKMTLAGKNGFLPYKATAELIKSSMAGPVPMEIVEGLRNPTLDKFLPKRKRAPVTDPSKAYQFEHPSYELAFVHFPIEDLGVPSSTQAVRGLIDDLSARIARGERMYIHCWGGRGRAGTIGACLLGSVWGISAEEALSRVQRAFDTRGDNKEASPETEAQIQFVKAFLAGK